MASGGPLEFLLTVARADGRRTDLVVEVSGDALVDDLAVALARHLDLPEDDLRLHSRRTDAWVPGRDRLADSDLRSGDELALAAGRRHDRLADGTLMGEGMQAAELVVTSGPAAGLRRPLRRRTYSVGRDPGCDMPIDDPSLSRRHLTLELTADGVFVRDAGSSNGTAVGGRRLADGEARAIGDGDEVQAGRTLLAVRATGASRARLPLRDGQVLFNRPPRVARPYEPQPPRVGEIPKAPRSVRLPLAVALIPLALGLAMAALLNQVLLLLFALLSPAMVLGTFISDKRSGRADHKRDVERFSRRLETLEQELSSAREREIAERRRAAPDAADLAARALRYEPALWERRSTDSDFLSLRVGVADQPALATIAPPAPDDDEDEERELRARLARIAARFATVPAVPVVADLRAAGAIGLCGDTERVASMGRALVLQLAALHSPRELQLAAAIAPAGVDAWSWLKWLPHARTDDGALLAAGANPARELLKAMQALVAARRSERGARHGAPAPLPAVVVVVDERVIGDRAAVVELLEDGPAVGVHTLWLGREQRDLPGECGRVVVLRRDVARATVVEVESGRVLDDVTADGLPLAVALETARALCPVRDVSTGAGQAELPRSVSLLELLDLPLPTGERLAERWRRREPAAVRAPIGVSASGVFLLDLLEDGPHMLVGGTTGAGKSELLQTMVGALAATLPPDRLSFLFVDYKAGTGLQDFEPLPHSVGIVTDLDGHLTQRALISLRAELKRRGAQLAAAGAKSLRDLERRRPDEAPARLILIVDEFATLANQVPEFMAGVVDIAQRGRALGVHLVLATQRPAGVVTADVRANTNLRIALRMRDVAESEDVIDAPVAARISRRIPGRAYARAGHGELELVQIAYAGGLTGGDDGPAEITVSPFEFIGDAPEPQFDEDEAEPAADSDLKRLVAAAAEAAELSASRLPPSPWLPQLPERLRLEPLGAGVLVGLQDEPAEQRQIPLALDLEAEGNVLVFGATKAGKTTLLRTLACSLARSWAPDELTILGLDCASRGLDVVAELPHCAGVVAVDDEERVARLLGWLRRTIDRRRTLLADARVSDIAAYRGSEPLPRVVLLLDSYGGFTAAFERADGGALVDLLPRIVADGRAAGVHVVASGDRRGAFPPAVLSIVQRKLVLRLADEDEYGVLGVDLADPRAVALPPGRGFTDETLEFQVALPFGSADADAVRQVAAELTARHGELRAVPLAVLPTALAHRDLPPAARPMTATLGIEEDDHAAVALDVSAAHALVAGPYRSGRTTALAAIARGLAASTPDAELHALVPRRRPLGELATFASTAIGAEDCTVAAARLAAVVDGRDPDVEHPPLVVFVDDGSELADGPAGDALALIVRRGRDVNVRVVTAFEVGTARVAYQPWIKELRKDGNGLLLDPDIDIDGDVLGVRLPRRRLRFPPGRGYFVDNGTLQLVQVGA